MNASESLNRCAYDGQENHWLDAKGKKTLCGKRFVEGAWKHNFYGLDPYCDICFMPTVSKPMANGGWLAPNGDYYPCGTREHVSAAIRLGDQSGGAGLEEKGWVHIYADGEFWVNGQGREKVTHAQLEVLGDILMKAESEGKQAFRENFSKSLKRVQEDDF